MAAYDQYNQIFKILLVGESKTGKSHVLHQFVKGTPLHHELMPTIGVEFATKTISTQNEDEQVKLQIWDTAGLERYKEIVTNHFRKSVGAFIFYDITNRETFTKVQSWIDELRNLAVENCQIYLIGNKKDLVASDPQIRQVQFEEGLEIALLNKITFHEISVYSQDEVSMIFQKMSTDLCRVYYSPTAKKFPEPVSWRKRTVDRKPEAIKSSAFGLLIFCQLMLAQFLYAMALQYVTPTNFYYLLGLGLFCFAFSFGIEVAIISLAVKSRKLDSLSKILMTIVNMIPIGYVAYELFACYSFELLIYVSIALTIGLSATVFVFCKAIRTEKQFYIKV